MVQDISPERWLPVVGFEGRYEVSDRGRVRSLNRLVRTTGGMRTHRGRILSTLKRDGDGYIQHSLCDGPNHRRAAKTHTLVLEAFVGPRGRGQVTRHLDGDVLNNQLSNLAWDSQAENVRDIVRHGRHREALKIQCPRLHPLLAPNLVAKEKDRSCLACARAATYVWRHPGADLQEVSDARYLALVQGAA